LSEITYPLEQGYIHNWLVAGPQARQVEDLERFSGPEYFKLQIARAYYDPEPGVAGQPAEGADVTAGDFQGRWSYYSCKTDHFVDLTAFYHLTHYLRAWGYARVDSPADRQVRLVLTTNGPADVWLNGEHCHRQEHFHHQIPRSESFEAVLKQGANEVLVRFEAVAARECPYAMALRLTAPDREALGGTVRLPTTLEPLERRQKLERVLDAAYTRKDVFHTGQTVKVHWPEDLAEKASVTLRLQSPANRIYAESHRRGAAGQEAPLGQALQFQDGDYRLIVMPRPKEYYEGQMRIFREIPVRVTRRRFSSAPYGTYAGRRQEALQEAVTFSGQNIFAEIAKVALGRWNWLDPKVILSAIERINSRADCSDFYLAGLLGMLYRYGDDERFPQALRQPLEDCILGFKYWNDEPGSDAMCYTTENHSILFHTCQVLAGQRYPEHVFRNNGQTGAWHQAVGEQRALEWLHKRAAGGFTEWDSNCYFEEDVLALTHLADLAESQPVWEIATVVLDKLFFTMAVNSYKGVFGSTHGRTYTPFIKGGRFEATSGISRLAWGMGAFNDHIMGSVSLGCSEYEVPDLIAGIAADQPDEMWDRERHAGALEDFLLSGSRGTGVNKVTYKTPDYMLCSAQDWHAGEPGYQQHIWQATLGPDAVVFVTHPTCTSQENSHRPNYWHGNASLPRVAQWKDVLVAVHCLPEEDWMGFTHAYFPVDAFDEWELSGGWAFARKGDGYLAIRAAREMQLTTRGDQAYRELVSGGLRNTWLVQMGRSALDGAFQAFVQGVLARPLVFEELGLRYTTLRGQELVFGWEGPLLLGGVEQPLGDFKHYDNPYCQVDLPARGMDIYLGENMMRLTFERMVEE
jgi:hypothetical protein